MEFRLLGAIEASSGGIRVDLGWRRVRALLAVLLLDVGRPVPVERLVRLLYPHNTIRDPRRALQIDVSRLRGRLAAVPGHEVGVHGGVGGYLVRTDPEAVDVHRFTALISRARDCGKPADRADVLRAALALWRGTPLADAGADDQLGPIRAGLEEQRLTAVELRIEADLELGRHRDLAAELAELTAQHPTRERLTAARMTALYRCGRKRDALQVYGEAADRLANELGLDPGPDLCALRDAILRDRADLTAPAETGSGSSGMAGASFLPRRVPGFTGRTTELEQLRERVAAEGDWRVYSVDGMAGVGKTAFAVEVAHAVASRFPDGQIFVDLYGHTPGEQPREPHAVLAVLLRQIGVAGEEIPRTTPERAALWHRETSGRRAVVVLDNAATSDQVGLLLPGAGCLTLITSRRRLISLDEAVPISLRPLDPHDARHLFAEVARLDPATAALEEIVRRCAYLPLAIRIAAARLGHRPSWTADDLLDRLQDGDGPGTVLDAGERSVVAAFEVSYAHLGPEQRRAFRLLGSQPMTTFDRLAAAALFDVSPAAADRVLEELVDAHLIEQPAAGRYRFHDLLKQFARRAAQADEPREDQREAVRRLLDYVLHVADLTHRVLAPHDRTVEPVTARHSGAVPVVADDQAALRWLDLERANLLAVIEFAATDGWDAHAWQLAWAMRPFHLRRGHLDDWLRSHELALDAARRHDAGGLGERVIVGYLGNVLGLVGRRDEAHSFAIRNLELAIQSGDRMGESSALSDLGNLHQMNSEYELAIHYLEAALAIVTDDPSEGARDAKANYLGNLALVLERCGRYHEAKSNLTAAVELLATLHDRVNQAVGLRHLGVVLTRLGDYESAETALTRSFQLAEEAGDRRRQGRALASLGALHIQLGRPDEAMAALVESRAILRACKGNADQLGALVYLGVAYGQSGRRDEAFEHHQAALDLAIEVRAVDAQAEILNNLGIAHFDDGDIDAGRRCHEDALRHATRTGLRYEVARSHRGLSRCAAHQRDHAEAARHAQHESAIWAQLGIPPPAHA